MRDPWASGDGKPRPPMRIFPRNLTDAERKWQQRMFDLYAKQLWDAEHPAPPKAQPAPIPLTRWQRIKKFFGWKT